MSPRHLDFTNNTSGSFQGNNSNLTHSYSFNWPRKKSKMQILFKKGGDLFPNRCHTVCYLKGVKSSSCQRFCCTQIRHFMYSHRHFCFDKALFMFKLTVFELETWFLVWMDVFDQNEDGSSCFLIFVLFDIRFLPFLKTLKNQKCHFLS